MATPEFDVYCRTDKEVQVLRGTPELGSKHSLSLEASALSFSPDGTVLALTTAAGIELYDAGSNSLLRRLDCPGLLAASFSPSGTWLVGQARPAKGTEPEPNLHVWRVADGEVCLSLHQKLFNREAWPAVKFGPGDAWAYRQVTNTVHAFDTSNWAAGVHHHVHIRGVSQFEPSPVQGDKPLLAAYCPEIKNSPASVGVYSSAQGADGSAISRKNFFRSNSAQLVWSPSGVAVLALTASDVDATNQSYYGEQKLFFLSADGKNECAVPLAKAGPVHDVQWAPNGKFFVVVAGFMPAKATLFTDACVPTYDLGSGPYSMARWNPFGRYLVLAGFGNLPGDMVFFEKKTDGKCRQIGSTRAENGVNLEWCPQGHTVLVSTTAPRLRVDNGVQLIRGDGTRLARREYPLLLQACWRPAAPGSVRNTPLPRSAAARDEAGGAAPPAAPAAAAAGYVPPHLRNNPAAAAAARSKFSLARDEGDTRGRIRQGAVAAGPAPGAAAAKAARVPPGAAEPALVSKSAAKNAKRRAKKKAEEGMKDLTLSEA